MADQVIAGTSSATGAARRSKGKFWSSENPWFWLTPAIIFLSVYSIFPLIYNIVLSLHEFKPRTKIFEFVGIQNWAELFTQDVRFGNAIGITIQYVVVAMLIQITLGMIIALLLDAKPWGATIMQALIILPMVTAPTVAGMLFRLLTHPNFGFISYILYGLGLVTPDEPLIGGTGRFALIGVLTVEIWQWTPFFVLIILAGLKGLPQEVLEAAEVDGANWWQRLTRVKIPMLRGVLTVAILFRLVDLYKVFDYVVILTAGGPGNRTETVSFYGYANTFLQVNWGYGAAIGLFMMVVVWLSAFAYIKLFRVRW
ncbi:MAG: sugar ABC transporter permease [Anaerolineae bacterium]|nr:sugar ABC transporter permease [Anaerolineae bacterium]